MTGTSVSRGVWHPAKWARAVPHPLAYDPVAASRERWIEQGWDDSAAGMAAIVSVMRAEQIFLNRATAILRPLGLTFARYQVLGMLRWTGPMTLGAVGHRLWITPATVTSAVDRLRSEEHTSELQSLMRISYAVFCLKKKK